MVKRAVAPLISSICAEARSNCPTAELRSRRSQSLVSFIISALRVSENCPSNCSPRSASIREREALAPVIPAPGESSPSTSSWDDFAAGEASPISRPIAFGERVGGKVKRLKSERGNAPGNWHFTSPFSLHSSPFGFTSPFSLHPSLFPSRKPPAAGNYPLAPAVRARRRRRLVSIGNAPASSSIAVPGSGVAL